MNASDLRAEARSKMAGKWGKAALIVLVYTLVFFLISFVQGRLPESIQILLSIAVFVIEIPLTFGLIIALLKLYNSEDVKVFDFFSLGFSNFSRSWSTLFHMILKLLVPIIILVVSIVLLSFGMVATGSSAIFGSSSTTGGFAVLTVLGLILYFVSSIWLITKIYYYALSYIVLADKPEVTGKEAVAKSKELMTNNRGRLFGLQFSFIGWAFLATLTFGIGYLWLLPYIQFATIAFYKKLSENNTVEANTTVESENSTEE